MLDSVLQGAEVANVGGGCDLEQGHLTSTEGEADVKAMSDNEMVEETKRVADPQG